MKTGKKDTGDGSAGEARQDVDEGGTGSISFAPNVSHTVNTFMITLETPSSTAHWTTATRTTFASE
jgi:hypothetical protein